MTENTTPAARLPRFVLPAVAGILSLAVGVGAFLVTSPLAAPREVPPASVEVIPLPEVSGLTPLEVVAAEEPAVLSTTTVLRTDAAADVRAALVDVLAEADAAARGETPPAESPIEGVTAADPCPEADGGACPDGSRATVLASTAPPALAIGMVMVGVDCPIDTTSSSFGVRVDATRPIALTLRVEVAGETRVTEVTTTADQAADWAAQGAGGRWPRLIHCVELTGFPAGWSGLVWADATAEDGSTARTQNRYATTSGLTVPPSWVRPITRTAVAMSIPAVDVSSVRFRAIAVPFGQPTPTCDFGEDVANVIEPREVVPERFTQDQMRELGYLPEYVERHTAFFVVPEASTVTLCAGWVDAHGWSGVLPDEVYSEVWYSPDLVLPRVTVEGFEVAPGVRPTEVRLDAAISGYGTECGSWTAGRSAPGELLCASAPFDGTLGWDAAITVTARGSALGSASTRDYLLPASARLCGLGCELPETTYVDVPVSFRDPCLGDCPSGYLGTARLRIDWEHGTRSWFGDWLAEDAGAPESDAPRLDTAAAPYAATETGADGEQYAEVVIESDVPTTAVMSVLILEEGRPVEVIDVRSTTRLETSRRMGTSALRGGGVYYAFEVELTDAEGRTSTYSGWEGRGRSWAAGLFITEPAEVELQTEVTIAAPDGGDVVLGSARLVAAGAGWRGDRPRVDESICGAGPVAVPFASDRATAFGRAYGNAFELTVEVDTGDTAEAGCRWPGRRQELRFTGSIPYDALLAGTTVTVTRDDGYVATIRLTPVG